MSHGCFQNFFISFFENSLRIPWKKSEAPRRFFQEYANNPLSNVSWIPLRLPHWFRRIFVQNSHGCSSTMTSGPEFFFNNIRNAWSIHSGIAGFFGYPQGFLQENAKDSFSKKGSVENYLILRALLADVHPDERMHAQS